MMHLEADKQIDWQKRERIVLAFFACGLIFFYLLALVAPQRWYDLYLSYGKAAVFAMAAIYFFFHGFRGVAELKLVIYYTIWFFLTRLLNTDWYLQNELDLVIARLLCCVILPVGLLLDGRQRRLLLDVVIAVSGLFFLVTALLALAACILGIYFYIPPEHVVFGFDSNFWVPGFYYIVAFGTNRTISAVWFYFSWCMMLYEFFRCENKLWRIPIVLSMLVFHLAIAFCFCRSIKLALSINVAMLVLLLASRGLKLKSRKLKALAVALLALVSLPLAYKSCDVLTAASAAIYNAVDPDIERTSDIFLSEAYSEETKDGQNFRDGRDLSRSISNMSNRRGIYASTVPTFRADPRRLLIGSYSFKMMTIPQQFMTYPYFHMHNLWLQVLMLTGLPGLLLVLAFCVLLIWRMLRLFFSEDPGTEIAVKILTFPLTGVMIYGMFETILFTQCADDRANTDFRELFFFLLAGIVLAYSYELAPRNRRKK